MTKGEIVKPEVADGLVHDVCIIIEQAQKSAYRAVNETLIKRNWLLGMRIQHEVLKDQRAEYGEQVIKTLTKELTERYKTGFTKTNLYNYVAFYRSWPDIFHAVSGKSEDESPDNIFHAMRGKFPSCFDVLQSLTAKYPIRLSWTHYRIILQETTVDGRAWYENEAAKYLTYMPTQEELRREIEQQKEFFRLQQEA